MFGPARVTVRGPVEHAVVEFDGEVDFAVADDVRRHVRAMPHQVVAIDVSGLDFVDGAGARMVLDLLHDVSDDRRAAAIGAAPAHVQRTLALVERSVALTA
jgi:anti-anti-sigma factor